MESTTEFILDSFDVLVCAAIFAEFRMWMKIACGEWIGKCIFWMIPDKILAPKEAEKILFYLEWPRQHLELYF